MIETTQYIRKPLYVDAVRVTAANFDEIAAWCQGEVQQDDVAKGHLVKKYIKVRVHNPKNPRQTKAFVGDWILYTERGYKVYTNKAFFASFDKTPEPIMVGSEEIAPGTTVNEAVEQLRNAEAKIAMSENQSDVPVAAEPETGAQPIVSSAQQEDETSAVSQAEPDNGPKGEATIHADKQVLSVEDQNRMDPDEIRELLKTGEWVLAQDLAA